MFTLHTCGLYARYVVMYVHVYTQDIRMYMNASVHTANEKKDGMHTYVSIHMKYYIYIYGIQSTCKHTYVLYSGTSLLQTSELGKPLY